MSVFEEAKDVLKVKNSGSIVDRLIEQHQEEGYLTLGKVYRVDNYSCLFYAQRVHLADSVIYSYKLGIIYFAPLKLVSSKDDFLFYTVEAHFNQSKFSRLFKTRQSGTNRESRGLFKNYESCLKSINEFLIPYLESSEYDDERVFPGKLDSNLFYGIPIAKGWYLSDILDTRDVVTIRLYWKYSDPNMVYDGDEFSVTYNKAINRLMVDNAAKGKDKALGLARSILSTKKIYNACLKGNMAYDYSLSVWDEDLKTQNIEIAPVDGFIEKDVIQKGRKVLTCPEGCVYILDRFKQGGTIDKVKVYDRNWKLIKETQGREV